MKTVTFVKGFSFNRQRNWHFQPRKMMGVVVKDDEPTKRVFTAKYLSKRKKFTAPKGPLARSFDEVKETAKKAGFTHVKMGKVEVTV